MSNTVSNITSGDNTTGHTAVASALGTALALIIVWLISLTGVSVPEAVEGAFAIVCSVLSSVAMQKVSV